MSYSRQSVSKQVGGDSVKPRPVQALFTSTAATAPVQASSDWQQYRMNLTVWKQFGASVFYGVTSILIVMVNKNVLTGYQ